MLLNSIFIKDQNQEPTDPEANTLSAQQTASVHWLPSAVNSHAPVVNSDVVTPSSAYTELQNSLQKLDQFCILMHKLGIFA